MKTIDVRNVALGLAVFGLLVASGCSEDGIDIQGTFTDDPVLTPIDILLDGAPDRDSLPDLNKADETFPRLLSLVEFQSPVKSQGSRGVCSVFSSTALMEHLYILEGSIANPNFSEQYLQWSVKNQVGAFRNTSGSNDSSNLQAISRFGIPEESAWPYEIRQWDESNDPDCAGEESLPTKCYTNGDPPQSAMDAQKYTLPSSQWVSARRNSIKAIMKNRGMAVVGGMDFFYQSWNHRRSQLPTNSEYWDMGYVLYPNEDDRRISLEKRAGHAILLVGWDDDLAVQRVDGEGNKLFDDNGNPLMEQGFFIFKNSWGTGSFGRNNPHGDGYGFISMRYIEEFASIRSAGLPLIERPEEICNDGIDNSGNGLTDCDDPVCSEHPFCLDSSLIVDFEVVDGSIPDNDNRGVDFTLEVEDDGQIRALTLSVDITHTYRGDLRVTITHPDGTAVVVQEPGYDGENDLVRSYAVEDFVGKATAGTWTLNVADTMSFDTGALNSASLEIVR